MAPMSYLQKHPKTGVYRIRRPIPEVVRYAFQGRAVFLKTLGTKDLAEAKRLAFPVLAELDERINRAKNGQVFWNDHDKQVYLARLDRFARSNIVNFSFQTPDQIRRDLLSRVEGWIQRELPSLSQADQDEFRSYLREELDWIRQIEGQQKPKPIQQRKSIRLKELLKKLLEQASYSKRSIQDVEKAFAYLIQLNGNVNVNEIGAEQIRELRDLLLKFPVKGRTATLKLRDAAKRNWEQTVNPRTVAKLVGFLSSGFKLALSEGWCHQNPVRDIKIQKATSTSQRTTRIEWSPDKLKQLFGSPIWTGSHSLHFRGRPGSKVIRNYKYWLPLLGLYSGCRLGELCQLETTDLLEDQGVWFLRITDRAESAELEKSLKTEGSRRDIPIHQELIRIGFLDWAKKQQNRTGMLFKSRYPAPDVLSREYSKQFRRYNRKIGLDQRGLVFHSLRHTFKTAARMANLPEEVNDCLTGHKPQSVASKYGKQRRLMAYLRDQIDRIEYPGLKLDRLLLRTA